MTLQYWLNYPACYRKQLKPLLNQQMWLFGRDILFPRCNLLYQYQFTHERAEQRGGSMYTRQDEDTQIILWGWGIWFGQVDQGSIFVNRFKARPRYTSAPVLNAKVHREQELPTLSYRVDTVADAQKMLTLWQSLLRWLNQYEAWVLETAGVAWRRTALKQFKHALTKPAAADEVTVQWQSLAEQHDLLSIKSYSH